LKVLGIDPSSALSGGALVEHKGKKRRLKKTMIWKKEEKRSHPWNLESWFHTVGQWIDETDPDMACIESLSVSRGAQVTRMIAFYQAIAVLACRLKGVMVIETRVSTARMLVLGNGGLSKEDAHKAVKKMFPLHKFKNFANGGSDETDATVLGAAGPDAAED
jgi:Holliday junction resolvasome RuvABC endonuclease subunit